MSDSHFAKPVRDAVDHADGQTFENSPLPPQSPAPVRDKLGSDGGTIVLHWLTVLSMVASLLTGLRISADGINAPWAAGLTAL
ncbi:MAG: cytochrome b/b6 domain-containing protein, partial [Pseudomonadota bacterium]